MSEGKIAVKLKLGEFEVQLEGTRGDIVEMLETDLPKIVESISKTPKPYSSSKEQPSPQVTFPPRDVESYPAIQAKSCADAIINLLLSAWGKKKPRSIAEIKSAFESNALHYTEKVIGFTLTRLTKKQKLRRWKTETGFVYIHPTVGGQ